MESAYKAIDGTWVLPSCVPVPGMGVIPVNAYLIKARVPVLVDTGLHADTEAFVATLRTLIDHINPLLPRGGDANIDGIVDIGDFASLAANFNMPFGAVWESGDFNYDNAVDIGDFSILAANFGFTGPTDRATVPEPAGAALLAALGVLRRRR